MDHVSFDGLVRRWAVRRGISQGKTGPGVVVARLNGVETGGPDCKARRRTNITDEGFHAGQIVCAVCLQGRLVCIFRHDGELFRCGGKRNGQEARTFRLLSSCEDRRDFWVVDNDLAFGEENFTIGVAHESMTNQGILEQRYEFA